MTVLKMDETLDSLLCLFVCMKSRCCREWVGRCNQGILWCGSIQNSQKNRNQRETTETKRKRIARLAGVPEQQEFRTYYIYIEWMDNTYGTSVLFQGNVVSRVSRRGRSASPHRPQIPSLAESCAPAKGGTFAMEVATYRTTGRGLLTYGILLLYI